MTCHTPDLYNFTQSYAQMEFLEMRNFLLRQRASSVRQSENSLWNGWTGWSEFSRSTKSEYINSRMPMTSSTSKPTSLDIADNGNWGVKRAAASTEHTVAFSPSVLLAKDAWKMEEHKKSRLDPL